MIQYIWQLPQNLMGLAMLLYFRLSDSPSECKKKGVLLCYASAMTGGLSLGNYIFLSASYLDSRYDAYALPHEFGHCRQSRMLGWLYLPIVGIPSLLHAAFYKYNPQDPDGYYRYWCEAWADRLGGVRRE